MPAEGLRNAQQALFRYLRKAPVNLEAAMLKNFVTALVLAAALAAPAAAQEKPALTVYTYASFTGKYGPGKALKDAFEKQCACALNFVTTDDGAQLVARLKLEGEATRADIVLGIDNQLVADMAATGLIAPHGLALPKLDLPQAWDNPLFIPYDWGSFAFVYDSAKLAKPPASLKELAERRDVKIIIQDPRTSTPGLGLLAWMRAAYGDKAPEMWRQFRPNVVTVTKGWSEAYGLFLKGEADMVLSYTTSPAYHIGAEKKLNFKAAIFEEGHILQIEVAGITRVSKQPELAKRFLAFMLSDEAQTVLPETNWMFPARTPEKGLPDSFKNLPRPSKTLSLSAPELAANRRLWIDEWLAAMAR